MMALVLVWQGGMKQNFWLKVQIFVVYIGIAQVGVSIICGDRELVVLSYKFFEGLYFGGSGYKVQC